MQLRQGREDCGELELEEKVHARGGENDGGVCGLALKDGVAGFCLP